MQTAGVSTAAMHAVVDGRDTKKVASAAKEFESMLLGTWLSAAEDSFAKLPGAEDEENADPGRDQFQSMAMQSLATSITEAGGIGIAKMIRGSFQGTQDRRNPVQEALAPPAQDYKVK